MKGVAAADAADRHPASPPSAIFGHRLGAILGTSRKKTAAMTQKRADRSLIDSNQQQNQPFHAD
jgi:hypothetical protein